MQVVHPIVAHFQGKYLAVICWTCHAQPGRPCTSMWNGSKVLLHPHQARKEALRQGPDYRPWKESDVDSQ